jgi:hypothetical protein
MIDFTSELAGIASENPPGSAYPECVSHRRAPALARRAVCVGTGERTLYFSGHYDVVPDVMPAGPEHSIERLGQNTDVIAKPVLATKRTGALVARQHTQPEHMLRMRARTIPLGP